MPPSERFRPRWYGNSGRSAHSGGRIQNDARDNRYLPMPILELAWQEYAAQGHGGQSLERIQERGGFGVVEAEHPSFAVGASV